MVFAARAVRFCCAHTCKDAVVNVPHVITDTIVRACDVVAFTHVDCQRNPWCSVVQYRVDLQNQNGVWGYDDLYDGLAEEIAEGTQILLDRGWEAKKVLDEALVAGMTIVGVDFRDGILFVPEVLLAANAMKAGMALLKPILTSTGAEPVGKLVIGTVKGDIHDIGKNLVGMMMEGAGFEVVDLGINTDVDTYLAALKEHRPNILGMSALLDDDHAVYESCR